MAKRKTTGSKTTGATKTSKSSAARSGVATKTAAKPAKSAASRKSTAKPAGSGKPGTKTSETSTQKPMLVSPEQRIKMIAEAAYYNSINNGQSNEVENWLQAEAQIDQQVRIAP